MPGLYIHVPFCVRRCLYCGFYLEEMKGPIPGRLARIDSVDHSAFLDGLELELKRLPEGFKPETVYIGGGTPTELGRDSLTQLFRMLKDQVDLTQVAECTVEANPATLPDGCVEILLAGGTTRVSLGVQSFNDQRLEFLGRLHNAQQAKDCVRQLRREGIENLNLDLIINLPETTVGDVQADLESLLALDPEHCSCYSLEFDPNTSFSELKSKGYMQELDEEICEAQYQTLCGTLQAAGYEQYELFNFAKPEFRSLHNMNYWRAGDYLGCGPSACSHWQGERWRNVPSLKRYGRMLAEGADPRVDRERLDPAAKARETLMIGLREVDGFEEAWFEAKTGFALNDMSAEGLEAQVACGNLLREGGRIRLSPAAYFISSEVFREIL